MLEFKPVIKSASTVLVHTPGLVRYGSKPRREIAAQPALLERLKSHLWTFDQARFYLPNQVFTGHEVPDRLREVDRPWYDKLAEPKDTGQPFGSLIREEQFIALLACADPFKHLLLTDTLWENVKPSLEACETTRHLASRNPALTSDAAIRIGVKESEIPLYVGTDSTPVALVRPGHGEDDSLAPQILLENLCCKVSAALAVRQLLENEPGIGSDDVDLILSCSEEAVGDRYQRGGGNLAKAIGQFAGCEQSSGFDIKDFCAAPVPAMVVAASLVRSGIFENVLVVGGSSLPKLGMKFLYHLEQNLPILEDVQAAVAVWIGRDDGRSPVVNLESVGRHPIKAGAALDQQLRALVLQPLSRLEWSAADVDRFVTELHNPDVTVPAKGGDVAQRNYRMLGAILAAAKEIGRGEISAFVQSKGIPGYAPTQGHIASAFVYVPHALRAIHAGEIRNCFFLARASLFLGQMTELSDGMSVLIERNQRCQG